MILVPMESHCIPASHLPHTTRLFGAFVDNFLGVAEFYSHSPTLEGVERSAREVRLAPETRREVVEILRAQNRAFGGDAAIEQNLSRLAAGAVAVVTGQQVGLFTGPSYSFYKAIGAVALARKLTERGVEAVPIFWLAAEDHDLAEVNHAWWQGRPGLERLEWPGAADGRRVGEVELGQAIVPVVERAAGQLEGPFADELARALRDCYAPQESFGSAFAKLMARVFAGRGLILLDPQSPRLHSLAATINRRAIEESTELTRELVARGNALEAAGFHAQVRVTESSTLLFLDVDGKRTPLRRRNHGFAAGSKTFAASGLLALLESEPHRFSANALLRPVVQDHLLPTAAYLGGPAEVAYFAQAEVIYKQLGVTMPAVLPRPGFTLVEPKLQRLLRRYGLEIGDFFAGGQKLRGKMEAAHLPKGLAGRFDRGEKALRATLEKLREPVGKVDATLLGALENAEKKMLYQFGKLRGRAARAEAFRAGVIDRHEKTLVESLFPHHGLQERSLCFLPFLARHGAGLLEELLRRTAEHPAPGSHDVIFL